MYIETETTPNPATLKFLPGRIVMPAGTADFPNADSAARSPLAQALFAVDGVSGVFFGSDFVTVTKGGDQEWHVMKPAVLGAIMEHFTAGKPIMLEGATPAAGAGAEGEDSDIVAQIKELLDTRVRPAVAQDGGDIVYRGYREGVVYVKLIGSCSSCPSSTTTLAMGVERMLLEEIPEVSRVEQVHD